MYGNVETALDSGGAAGEGCPQVPPPPEDPYEPLDPSPTPGTPPKPRPSPPGPAPVAPRGTLVALVALVALAVTLLLLLGTLGARRISALEAALEAEKAKEPPPTAASSPFLIYNQHHSGCVVTAGPWLSLAPCAPSSPSQLFQWLPGGLLRHAASGRCAGASAEAAGALLRLGPCRGGRLQRWACGRGALLALGGSGLFFNFGHERQRRAVLYGGTGNWSRWLAHGSRRDVCSRASFLPCSRGWVFFGNSCYFFSDLAASWENSRIFCRALGAELLEVDGAEEKLHVQAQLQGPSWIHDRDPKSSWEKCGAVGPDGLRAEFPCGTSLSWVCEEPL